MKSLVRFIVVSLLLVSVVLLLLLYDDRDPAALSTTFPEATAERSIQQSAVSVELVESDADPEEKPSLFSSEMQELVGWIDAGRSLQLSVGEETARQYAFRPAQITTDSFQISSSPSDMYPSAWRVYHGREILDDGRLGDSVSLAVVNDSVSMAVEQAGRRYLVETDAGSGTLYATALYAASSGKEEHDCESLECSHVPGESIAGVRAPEGMRDPSERRLAVTMELAGAGADEPVTEAAWVDHPYFRLGPQYDASLKDILVLMVSSQSQTGSSANLSSRAASYLTYAARVADSYERQLGLRYLLQELVLLANDSGQDDIDYDDSVVPNNSSTGSDDLGALEDWCDIHRPQSTYGWGHAAGWTLVENSGGGTIGWAWVDAYGSSSYAFSVQERNYDWDVHSHELGHNVGASHTQGGVMNSFLSNNNENFFTENAATGGYTAAMDIYNYMSASSRNYIFGPADLRHPEEMPFGVDDTVATALNTPVTFSPLSNDDTSVLFGATNSLSLVEVGQVFPKAAGSAQVVGNQITFTPSVGFTGNVWFSYTMSGNVGNGGLGWLHAADVVVTVGGNNSNPTLTPAIDLTDDSLVTDFSGEIRINPLLNDEGTGRLWAGDVDVLNLINGTAQSYSEESFYLVSATLLSGNGSLAVETINMTRDASQSTGNTGYLVYTSGSSEPDPVVIEYTVEDEGGNQSTATITLTPVAAVEAAANVVELIETDGRVATVTFSRNSSSDKTDSETVTFNVGGDVDYIGANADLALSGYTTFDPSTLQGTVVIPAGASSVSIVMSAIADGVSEVSEEAIVTIVNTETNPIGIKGSATFSVEDIPAIGTDLYAEDFDNFSEPFGIGSGEGSAWTNDSGEAAVETDWEVESGTTFSGSTGPNGDYTSGSGNYLYIEASGHTGASANLISPSYDLSGESDLILQFSYHMFGSTMGDLHVDVRVDNGVWQTDIIPVFSGQQSVNADDWKVSATDFSAFAGEANVQIRFRGIIGSNFISDICIDDVRILRTTPPQSAQTPIITGQPVSADLDLGDPLYMAVVSESYPVSTYQWKLNGFAISGATDSIYYLPSVAAADAGVYTVDVSSGSTVASASAFVTVDGTLFSYGQDWKDRAFGEGENGVNTDALADFNSDGRLNILDYAFQILTTTDGDAVGKLPVFNLQEVSSDVFVEISFRRIVMGSGSSITSTGYTAGGVNYVVQYSDTLATDDWETGSSILQEVGSPISNGDGTETVRVRLSSPVNDSADSKGFLRIKIE